MKCVVNWGGVLKDADLSPFGSYFFNPLAGWVDAGLALKIMASEAIRMGVRYDVGEAARLVLGAHGIESVETKTAKSNGIQAMMAKECADSI